MHDIIRCHVHALCIAQCGGDEDIFISFVIYDFFQVYLMLYINNNNISVYM